MKIKFAFLTALVFAVISGFGQQVPNGGFETWTNAVTPQSWTSVEQLLNTTTNILTFKDTLDFIEGAASIKLVSDSIPGQPHLGVLSGETSLGSIRLVGNTAVLSGVPFAFRPDSFIFSYKYSASGTDSGTAEIFLTKNQGTQVLGWQGYLSPQTAWTKVAIPLTFIYDTSGLLPDSMAIQFKSSHARAQKGSTLHVDGVRLGYVNQSGSLVATVTPTGPTTFCNGDSVILQANTGSGYLYQWKQNGSIILGGNNSTYVAKTSGAYSVTIDSGSVHSVSATVVVTVNPGPQAYLTGLNDTVCNSAGPIALTGGSPSGGTYSGTGVTGSSFVPQSAGPGVKIITYTIDSLNCIGTASATITVMAAAVTLTGLNDSVCNTASAITLSGGSPAGGTYSGNGVTASTFTPSNAPVGRDTIVYTATDANQCTGSASATITVLSPAVSLTGLNDTLCSNASAVTLSGGSPSGGSYSGNGVTASTFTPSALVLGRDTIVYTATDANNCTGTASATIYVEVCGGINNIPASEISVYPNPVTNLLNINTNASVAGYNLGVYDLQGRLLVSHFLTGYNNAINVSQLANGAYVYRITNPENGIVAQGKFDVVR